MPAAAAKNDEGKVKLTPMLQQFYQAKEQYPDAILMFRMGDFYEMFESDAEKAAKVLDIVLTSRHKYKDGPKMSMCGVPYHAVDSYLAKLVKAGFKVAICEQMEDPRQVRGIVKREVVRVVTPGTFDNQHYLSSQQNNYLLTLHPHGKKLGAAWSDVTTGELWVRELSFSSQQQAWSQLQALITRLQPAEILLNEKLARGEAHPMVKWLREQQLPLSLYADWAFSPANAQDALTRQFSGKSLRGFGLDPDWQATTALGALLSYLEETQKQALRHLNQVGVDRDQHSMFLDSTTIQSLELLENQSVLDSDASLLGVLKKEISTSMGHRLLKRWLVQPLVEKGQIEDRLTAVDFLKRQHTKRAMLQDYLTELGDLERLSARLALKRIAPPELCKLSHSVEVIAQLAQAMEDMKQSILLKKLGQQLVPLPDLLKKVNAALVEEPAAILGRGGEIIRPEYHQEFQELTAIQYSGKDWIRQFEQREKEKTGIQSLKVRFNKVFGYYIEISKANLRHTPENYIRKQTLTNAERFITPVLKEYEAKVLGAEERLMQLEAELYEQLLDELQPSVQPLQTNAQQLAELDVLLNFALLAEARGYQRPQVHDGTTLKIEGGRHPVVEQLHSGRFTPNSTHLSSDQHQIIVLTGPNMAGKSTYLRQVALITLMAQVGCFVPAAQAEIGVVDRIFTRIGASDNLARGQSTFMIEMQEAANILNNATDRSLIILDELGRGTSTFDGLSLAWAVVEHLHGKVAQGPKTLFATHYHELTQLEEDFIRIENWNVAVREQEGKILFLHQIKRGGVDDSYGIHVAQLAGIPDSVIDRAQQVLARLEGKEGEQYQPRGQASLLKERAASLSQTKVNPNQTSFLESVAVPNPVEVSQLSAPLISSEQLEVLEELEQFSLDQTTPLQALNVLAEWKKKL